MARLTESNPTERARQRGRLTTRLQTQNKKWNNRSNHINTSIMAAPLGIRTKTAGSKSGRSYQLDQTQYFGCALGFDQDVRVRGRRPRVRPSAITKQIK